MDTSLDSLTGLPSAGTAFALAGNTGARPNAAAAAPAGSGFERLMGLQQRGRALETKLAKQASGADTQDPASAASGQQHAFNAGELKAIRELVGPNPGGNARRALAAILERLEGGGELKGTDRTRIRLAIAADDKRVDVAGAARVRAAILSLDGAFETTSQAMQDPTLVQDPARLATSRAQNQHIQDQLRQLDALIDAGTFDARSVNGIFDARR